MKTDISRLLKKGNLTPKERVVLTVNNSVMEEREGKGFLTDAEKYELTLGWEANSNEEIKAYNRYIEAWRTVGYAEFDAQTVFLQGEKTFYRALWILKMEDNEKPQHLKMPSMLEKMKGSPYKDKALAMFLENSGYNYHELILDYACNEFGDESARGFIHALSIGFDWAEKIVSGKFEEVIGNKPTADEAKKITKLKPLIAKAKAVIDGLISEGKLQVVDKTEKQGDWYIVDSKDDKTWRKASEIIKEDTGKVMPIVNIKLVTGKSLHSLTGYKFADDYKATLSKYLPLAEFITRVKDEGVVNIYSVLLSYLEMFKRLSKTFRTDLTYKMEKWLDTTKNEIQTLNVMIRSAQNDITDELDSDYYTKGGYHFCLIESDIAIDIDAIKPDNERLRVYFEELEKKLEKDF